MIDEMITFTLSLDNQSNHAEYFQPEGAEQPVTIEGHSSYEWEATFDPAEQFTFTLELIQYPGILNTLITHHETDKEAYFRTTVTGDSELWSIHTDMENNMHYCSRVDGGANSELVIATVRIPVVSSIGIMIVGTTDPVIPPHGK